MANINLTGTIHQELQSKVITDRMLLLETSMGNLCENFGKIARKNARLRDTSDHLVAVINEYSGKEKINTSSKKGLVNYSSFLSAVEDYRTAMIDRVEKKIIQPISKYQEYLRASKKTIKSTLSVRDKEKQKQQKLNQLLQKQPDDGRNIAQAEANAESASQKVSTQDRILNEEIDKLEEKKLKDMKNLLMEYTHIQMIFHAKALEMLTIAYQELQEINTDSDLEEFRNTFVQTNQLKQYQLSNPIGSKNNLNMPQKNSYENIFNETNNSLPNTPNRSRSSANNNDSLNNQRRAKSNENLKQIKTQATSNSNLANSRNTTNNNNNTNNKNFHSSAPHLNNSRSQMDVEDLTDDSDAE